jgi:hypothetical protein
MTWPSSVVLLVLMALLTVIALGIEQKPRWWYAVVVVFIVLTMSFAYVLS